MAGRAVADLRAAVGVGGGRDLRIELNRSEPEPGAVAIDEPHELAAQRHPRLIRRPLALRECRAEREGDREDREKELLHGATMKRLRVLRHSSTKLDDREGLIDIRDQVLDVLDS